MGVYINGMDKETAVRICAYVGIRGMDDSDFVPVPPHGRLIDADALFHKMEEVGWYDNADRDEIAEMLVMFAPTIIPADGKDGAE